MFKTSEITTTVIRLFSLYLVKRGVIFWFIRNGFALTVFLVQLLHSQSNLCHLCPMGFFKSTSSLSYRFQHLLIIETIKS